FCWGILSSFFQVQFGRPQMLLAMFGGSVRRWLCLIVLCAVLPFLSFSVQGWGDAAETYGVGAVAFVCAVIVWVATLENGSPNNSLLRRISLFLGARSYSLYVTHLIVFMIVRDLWDLTASADSPGVAATLFLVVLSLTLTLLATELNYRFIETRLRTRGRVFADHLLY